MPTIAPPPESAATAAQIGWTPLDFTMPPGCVLAGFAGDAAWYSDRYERLRWKHWPSVLA